MGIDFIKYEALLAGINDLIERSPEQYREISRLGRHNIAEFIVKYLPSISQEQLNEVDYMIANFIEDYNKANIISPITFVNRPTALEKRHNNEKYHEYEECRGCEPNHHPPESLIEKRVHSSPLKTGFLNNFVQTIRNNNARYIERARDKVDVVVNNLKTITPLKTIKKGLRNLRLEIDNFLVPYYSAASETAQYPQLTIRKNGSIAFSQHKLSENNIYDTHIHIAHNIHRLNEIKTVGSKERPTQVRDGIFTDVSKENDDESTYALFKDFLDYIIASVHPPYVEDDMVFHEHDYLNDAENPYASSNKKDAIKIQSNL